MIRQCSTPAKMICLSLLRLGFGEAPGQKGGVRVLCARAFHTGSMQEVRPMRMPLPSPHPALWELLNAEIENM